MKASLVILMCFLAGLSGAAPVHLAFTQPVMGSVFRIELYAEDKEAAERAVAAAFKRVDDINAIASDYLPESELSRLNREPADKAVPVSADLFALISKSLDAAKQTDGAFDLTAAYAVQQWRRAKRQKQLPTAEQTAKAVAMTDWKALRLGREGTHRHQAQGGPPARPWRHRQRVCRRCGARRPEIARLPQALVAGSGDLAIGDAPPGKPGWSVALRTFESPEESDRLIHVALSRCGCSTSGDLHQFLELDGKRFSHIVNPTDWSRPRQTGSPAP